jgi:hypothetical protein
MVLPVSTAYLSLRGHLEAKEFEPILYPSTATESGNILTRFRYINPTTPNEAGSTADMTTNGGVSGGISKGSDGL